MSLRDDINIPVITVLGITTGLIVAVAIVGTQAGYNYVTQVDLARNYATAEERGILHFGQNVLNKQAEAMSAPQASWVDVEKTMVRLPLDQAKQMMLQSKGKAMPAQPPATQPKK